MPLPTQVHRDRALENISVAFKSEGLIAEALAPSVQVKHESDVFYVYSRESLILPQTARAASAESNRWDWSLSTATYLLEEHSLHTLIPDRVRDNADQALKLDVDATEQLTEKILMRREVDLATIVGTAANWANTTSLTAGGAWNANTTLSTPILNVDSAASTIAQNSGKMPNTICLDFRTFQAAKEHSSTVDRIKYTSADSVTESILASLFNMNQVLVARGIQNTGAEGLSETMAFIWTDVAFVAYIEPSPGLKKPSALYSFTQMNGGGPFKVTRWREDKRKSDAIEVSSLFDNNVIASACAYLIVNTIQ